MELKSHNRTVYDVEHISTKEKIVLVTIDLIEKIGMNGLTTRSIANAADVNTAAINYYFGTKQKLIDESLQTAMDHLFTDMNETFSMDMPDKKILLENVMLYFLEGAIRFPGIIKAIFHEPIVNNNYDGKTIKQLIEFFEGLISKVESASNESDLESISISVIQLISTSLFPAFMPGLVGRFLGEDFFIDFEKQKEYVLHLFNE